MPQNTVDPDRVKKERRLTKASANGLILRAYMRGLKPDAGDSCAGP